MIDKVEIVDVDYGNVDMCGLCGKLSRSACHDGRCVRPRACEAAGRWASGSDWVWFVRQKQVFFRSHFP